MEKKQASYDAILIAASNLTVAVVNKTPIKSLPGQSNYSQPEDSVWNIFTNQVARLEKLLATKEAA